MLEAIHTTPFRREDRAPSLPSSEDERIPAAPPVPRSGEDSDNVSRTLAESFGTVTITIESFRHIAAFDRGS